MKKFLCACAAIFATSQGAAAADGILNSNLIEIARKSLTSVQNQSFSSGREYCGMIGLTTAGELIVSPARRGRASGCDERGFVDSSIKPVASYHTHGGFEADYDSEVPSVDDVDMDHHRKVFGFVATPGGRFWMIDYRSRTAKLVCGIGCLPKDPRFETGMAGDIPEALTRKDLVMRKRKGGPAAHRHTHEVAHN